MNKFSIGDRVRIVRATTPEYNELTGTVVGFPAENMSRIRLDVPIMGVGSIQTIVRLYNYKLEFIEPAKPIWEI